MRTSTSIAGPPRLVAEGGNDGLVIELEAVFLQRALQPLQPLDLAGVARKGFIARGVHGDAARALLLRHVARGVRRGEQLFERAALARDLDEADRRRRC